MSKLEFVVEELTEDGIAKIDEGITSYQEMMDIAKNVQDSSLGGRKLRTRFHDDNMIMRGYYENGFPVKNDGLLAAKQLGLTNEKLWSYLEDKFW